jgi:hypothetical protein
MGYIEIMEE